MAGVQLTAQTGVTDDGTSAVVTVPADESWLVYRCIVTDPTFADNNYAVILFASNPGIALQLAYGQATSQPAGQLDAGAFVMNANDEIRINTAGAAIDFYMSGLIQRGPGQVPS